MTTSIHAELPEKLVEEARKFVEAGWATDVNQLIADALQRYLGSHAADSAEAFIREDAEWGLRGRD
ncbi:MAG: CopG family transcriptional regulator [Planctomycetota bacterium]